MTRIIEKVFGVPFSWRQRRLARNRTALNREQFVERITREGGDRAAAGALWTRLKDWTYSDDFTPYPSDDLQAVYGIAEEELDEDLILALLRELNVDPPNPEFLRDFGAVRTPFQVALLVARCR